MIEMRERKLFERKKMFSFPEKEKIKDEKDEDKKIKKVEDKKEPIRTIEEIKMERIERAEIVGRIIKSCPTTPTIELKFDRRKPRGERFKRMTGLL